LQPRGGKDEDDNFCFHFGKWQSGNFGGIGIAGQTESECRQGFFLTAR
jgi:hypothetical protein